MEEYGKGTKAKNIHLQHVHCNESNRVWITAIIWQLLDAGWRKGLLTSDISSRRIKILLMIDKLLVWAKMSKQYLLFIAVIPFLMVSSASAVYAQQEVEPISGPILQALTTFFNNIAEASPRVIAVVILLLIGLGAGKGVGRGVENLSRKILQKTHLETVSSHEVIMEITGKHLDSPTSYCRNC